MENEYWMRNELENWNWSDRDWLTDYIGTCRLSCFSPSFSSRSGEGGGMDKLEVKHRKPIYLQMLFSLSKKSFFLVFFFLHFSPIQHKAEILNPEKDPSLRSKFIPDRSDVRKQIKTEDWTKEKIGWIDYVQLASSQPAVLLF